MKKIIFILVGFAFSQTVHFEPIYEGTPNLPMTFYVINAIVNGYHNLAENDEIGVFDGTRCVGAIALSEYDIEPIIASKDDGSGNGFTEGNSISFKFWLHEQNLEIDCDAISFYESGTGIEIDDQSFEESGAVDVSLDATEPLHYSDFPDYFPENFYSIYVENVSVSGGEISEGDEIAVFCPSDDGATLIFSGAGVYRAEFGTISIKSFEDDTFFTPDEQNGFVCDRTIIFKIWFHNFATEIDADADFIVGDGTFCDGFSSKVNLSVESPTAVEPRLGTSKNIDKLSVLPNPVFDGVTLSFEGFGGKRTKAAIYDLTGRIVHSFYVSERNKSVYWELTDQFGCDVSAGIYFLRCKDLEEKILIIR